MSTDDKEKITVDDLPVPLKDSNPNEEEEVKGGLGIVNPTKPVFLNPISTQKPIVDSY